VALHVKILSIDEINEFFDDENIGNDISCGDI